MKVVLSKEVQKEYSRLPKKDQIKIRKKLISLKEYPFAGKKLGGELGNFFSLQAWPYRIVYGVNKREKRIEVHRIAHRQGAYRD